MAIDARIEQLGQRHRELDEAIAEEETHPGFDESRVREMKRHKLRLRDELEMLKSQDATAA